MAFLSVLKKLATTIQSIALALGGITVSYIACMTVIRIEHLKISLVTVAKILPTAAFISQLLTIHGCQMEVAT